MAIIKMSHKERFMATVERKDVDRPASWLGMPTPEAIPALLGFFKTNSLDGLRKIIDDDIYPVEIPCHFPRGNEIYSALRFVKNEETSGVEKKLTAPGFFEDYESPDKINDFDWPDPKKYIDPEECRNAVSKAPGDKAIMCVLWSCHFQNACEAFGMETALVKMLLNPEMYRAVIDKITEFYLKANEIVYEAVNKKIDAVLIGNDLGSQYGLMLSPQLIREFVIPGTKRLVTQAKSYGLKVIHHSCGAIFDIIPDFIDAGVDVIHPVQALAAGMEPSVLRQSFGERVSFCGGVDAQQLLVHGTPDEIREKVYALKKLFPTGFIISPSHEAILPDAAPENIHALFEAVNL